MRARSFRRHAIAFLLASVFGPGGLQVLLRFRTTGEAVVNFAARLARGATPGECDYDRDRVVAFVGERLEVRQVPILPFPDSWRFDEEFIARYEVLDVIRGDFDAPEIEFFAYDHYGLPEFGLYHHSLLYVVPCGDFWIHEKYQYDPVYRTRDGSWAGCGDPYAREPEVHRGTIEARPVAFDPEVTFPMEGLSEAEREKTYPSRYFAHQGDEAVCRAGARAEELLSIKLTGVIAARASSE